ncbi:MAG: hypothetical protein ACOCWQ_04875 [Nanoarchaeota archaeon]
MQLTDQERQILTVMQDCQVGKEEDLIRRFTSIPVAETQHIIGKLQQMDLILQVRLGDTVFFTYTNKVDGSMLDDDLRYRLDKGVRTTFTYPVRERKKQGRCIALDAGRGWVENKVRRYEGFVLRIPEEVDAYENVVFAVLKVRQADTHGRWQLLLHAHASSMVQWEPYDMTSDCYIDDGGDVETVLEIDEKLLSKWTGLSAESIREGAVNTHVGYTYNLLCSLPRTVTVFHEAVQIEKSLTIPIDPHNVCTLLLKKQYPLDHASNE